MKNKKASSLSSWTETIVLTMVFVIAITAVLASFNSRYDKSYDVGLDTSSLQSIENTIDSSYNQTGGEVSQTSDGLTLLSSWTIAKGILDVTWNVINGGWISSIIINQLKIGGTLGITLAFALRALFLLGLIFAILRLFFKTGRP